MKSSENIIASHTRIFPAPKGYTGTMHVTAKAYQLGGNKHPHFSITAAIGTPSQMRTGNWQAGGCLHDEILKAWPEAKPLVDLHLSNTDDGEPMHAEANGFYWLAKAAGIPQKYGPDQSPDECITILAKHLRISEEDANQLTSRIRIAYAAHYKTPAIGQEQAKALFSAFIEANRPRWAQEAKDGLALILALAHQSEQVAA